MATHREADSKEVTRPSVTWRKRQAILASLPPRLRDRIAAAGEVKNKAASLSGRMKNLAGLAELTVSETGHVRPEVAELLANVAEIVGSARELNALALRLHEIYGIPVPSRRS